MYTYRSFLICRIVVVSGFIIASLGFCNAQDKILVAAASDLKFALDSVIIAFTKTNEGKIGVTYGSSGKLTEQIVNGAPFDLFFSADIVYPQQLAREKKTSSDIYRYAKGRIVLWSNKIDPCDSEMKSLLQPGVKKIAIANPMHAPYGKRALESLEYYNMSDILKSKLVYGENISQTAQFVSTGAADIGVIALSLALSPNMKSKTAKYFVIPEESHQPLIQGAVITRHGKESKLAASFFEFIKSPQAVSILAKYGFSKP
jgi:molybdate transport system substrate-binding protein